MSLIPPHPVNQSRETLHTNNQKCRHKMQFRARNAQKCICGQGFVQEPSAPSNPLAELIG